jgi:hypothetical protein
MHPLYQHLSLPSPTEESAPSIRLLRLGGTDHHAINKLEVFSLQRCPEYRALSYCWGDPEHLLPLNCNAVAFDITRNLHSALEHLQVEYASQLLWIDAICIYSYRTIMKPL